jgi:hypothetical protein
VTLTKKSKLPPHSRMKRSVSPAAASNKGTSTKKHKTWLAPPGPHASKRSSHNDELPEQFKTRRSNNYVDLSMDHPNSDREDDDETTTTATTSVLNHCCTTTTACPSPDDMTTKRHAVGIVHTPEMKFIDSIVQKLTGRPQEKFKAIAAKVMERHHHHDNTTDHHENLPKAILLHVRELMEPTDYMGAYHAAWAEWKAAGGTCPITTTNQPTLANRSLSIDPTTTTTKQTLMNAVQKKPVELSPKRTVNMTHGPKSPSMIPASVGLVTATPHTNARNRISASPPHHYDSRMSPTSHHHHRNVVSMRTYSPVRFFSNEETAPHYSGSKQQQQQQPDHRDARSVFPPARNHGRSIPSPVTTTGGNARYSPTVTPPVQQYKNNNCRPPPTVRRLCAPPPRLVRAAAPLIQRAHSRALSPPPPPQRGAASNVHSVLRASTATATHHPHRMLSSSSTNTTASSSTTTKSALQLALRFGFALCLKQQQREQQHQQQHDGRRRRSVAVVALGVEEMMEKAERKLNSMTPAERDLLWGEVVAFTDEYGCENEADEAEG